VRNVLASCLEPSGRIGKSGFVVRGQLDRAAESASAPAGSLRSTSAGGGRLLSAGISNGQNDRKRSKHQWSTHNLQSPLHPVGKTFVPRFSVLAVYSRCASAPRCHRRKLYRGVNGNSNVSCRSSRKIAGADCTALSKRLQCPEARSRAGEGVQFAQLCFSEAFGLL